MKIYLTTDTHFGHEKMIEYCGRPEGFEKLIARGFAIINADDVLIHLGDVCIGQDSKWHDIIEELNCRKFLVRGNHDKKSNQWYLNHGWDFVGEQIRDTYFGKKIVFSHAPIKLTDPWELNIHGHFHNALPRLLEGEWKADGGKERNEQDLLNLRTENHKLLALEYTDYKPVNLQKFI